jgi:hypothetical protein
LSGGALGVATIDAIRAATHATAIQKDSDFVVDVRIAR